MENNYSFILEGNRERRAKYDKPLITYWLWAIFYIVWLYAIVIIQDPVSFLSHLSTTLFSGMLWCMIYIQTKRANAFIERKIEWYTNLVEFTNQHSDDSESLKKLNYLVNPVMLNTRMKMINSKNLLIILGIDFVLFPIVGLIAEEQKALTQLLIIAGWVMRIIIYEYPMNILWNKIQCFENEFDSTLSEVWIDNGWIEKSIEFYIDPSKKRNFFLWVFYSIITCGIMMVIWSYKIYTDPDNMYEQFHDREDKILEVIEKIEQQKRAEIEN